MQDPTLAWTTIMTSMESTTVRAVFLDANGILMHEVRHSGDPADVGLTRRVGEGLRQMQDAGYLLIVASRHPGVTGRYPASALTRIEARIDELLTPFGVMITDYCWCTHHSVRLAGTPACVCRKPRPGLLLDAAAAHAISLRHSWMVADVLDDVEAGARVGCQTILVDRGNETRWRAGRLRTPRAIVYDFADAVSFILDGPRKAHAPRPAAGLA